MFVSQFFCQQLNNMKVSSLFLDTRTKKSFWLLTIASRFVIIVARINNKNFLTSLLPNWVLFVRHNCFKFQIKVISEITKKKMSRHRILLFEASTRSIYLQLFNLVKVYFNKIFLNLIVPIFKKADFYWFNHPNRYPHEPS